MQTMFNLPQYKAVYYHTNPQTGYYTKTKNQPCKTPVMRLPFELRVTPAQVEKIKCNAKELIVSRERFKTGSYKFITGIQPTNFKQWFAGNDYEIIKGEKKLTLCLFHFTQDNSLLTTFYFGRFYIDNRESRERFINDVIPYLLHKHFI